MGALLQASCHRQRELESHSNHRNGRGLRRSEPYCSALNVRLVDSITEAVGKIHFGQLSPHWVGRWLYCLTVDL